MGLLGSFCARSTRAVVLDSLVAIPVAADAFAFINSPPQRIGTIRGADRNY
jgi:hypothetical protein